MHVAVNVIVVDCPAIAVVGDAPSDVHLGRSVANNKGIVSSSSTTCVVTEQIPTIPLQLSVAFDAFVRVAVLVSVPSVFVLAKIVTTARFVVFAAILGMVQLNAKPAVAPEHVTPLPGTVDRLLSAAGRVSVAVITPEAALVRLSTVSVQMTKSPSPALALLTNLVILNALATAAIVTSRATVCC